MMADHMAQAWREMIEKAGKDNEVYRVFDQGLGLQVTITDYSYFHFQGKPSSQSDEIIEIPPKQFEAALKLMRELVEKERTATLSKFSRAA